MKEQLSKLQRSIYFYELNLEFKRDFTPDDGDQFRGLFKLIIDLSKTKAAIRYQQFQEKSIFIQDIKFMPETKRIIGLLRSVRLDLLPEIINTKTDTIRGLEALEEEGLVETTHFLIDYSRKTIRLAIEYNQFGAKINDFVSYIQNIGIHKKALIKIAYIPIIKDELSTYTERINRCSEFTMKIHRNNIEKIKVMDKSLYSAAKSASEHFRSDYITLDLKFDYRKRMATTEINNSIFNLSRFIMKDRKSVEVFDTLEVKAEDSYSQNKLQIFDLLFDKEKCNVFVQRKPRYRTVISADMFKQMGENLDKFIAK